MINRTLVRTKVVQTLFAYYKDGEKNTLTAKKQLLKSFSNTYSLYMLMLDLVNEITTLAEERIENETERAKVLHEDYTPNLRFVNNRFAQQIFNNRQLRGYMAENKLSWDVAHDSLRLLWKQIQVSAAYQEFMAKDEITYDDEKMVWRKIFVDTLVDNEEFDTALEELEIKLDGCNWATDANVVISYIVKTIKRFALENSAEQTLLEMFDSEDELNFARQLLQKAIDKQDEYHAIIEAHLKNWDLNRIASMDLTILHVALTEIMEFPNIALQVSMNEYLELAKEYSSDKSHIFVNGILDEIVRDLKSENRLIKAVSLD